MGLLLFQVIFIEDPKSTSGQNVENTNLLSPKMMGVNMQVLLHVGFLPKYLMRERATISLEDENIKEGKVAINFSFYGELNGA